jgi:hypothetical protein
MVNLGMAGVMLKGLHKNVNIGVNDVIRWSHMLNIPIPDQLQSFVEQQAIDTGFPSARDYVLHLIEKEQRRLEVGIDRSIDRETDPVFLMTLPLADRRRILAAQADLMVAHYEQDTEWREFMGGASSQAADSWMKDAGMFETEPLFDQVLEEIAVYRREMDVDRPELHHNNDV